MNLLPRRKNRSRRRGGGNGDGFWAGLFEFFGDVISSAFGGF